MSMKTVANRQELVRYLLRCHVVPAYHAPAIRACLLAENVRKIELGYSYPFQIRFAFTYGQFLVRKAGEYKKWLFAVTE